MNDDTKLSKLQLPTRVRTVVRWAVTRDFSHQEWEWQRATVADLRKVDLREIERSPNCGKATFAEVKRMFFPKLWEKETAERSARTEAKERAELARLKAKYETTE